MGDGLKPGCMNSQKKQLVVAQVSSSPKGFC